MTRRTCRITEVDHDGSQFEKGRNVLVIVLPALSVNGKTRTVSRNLKAASRTMNLVGRIHLLQNVLKLYIFHLS